MAFVVVKDYSLVIGSAQAAIDFLGGKFVLTPSPFPKGKPVSIVDRSALPVNVGMYQVGIVIECPPDVSVCWVLVLKEDATAAVVAIPKAHLVAIG